MNKQQGVEFKQVGGVFSLIQEIWMSRREQIWKNIKSRGLNILFGLSEVIETEVLLFIRNKQLANELWHRVMSQISISQDMISKKTKIKVLLWFLTIALTLVNSQNTSVSSKKITLLQKNPICATIIIVDSHSKVILGYPLGKILVIDLSTEIGSNVTSKLTNSVRQIIPYSSHFFARDLKRVVRIDLDSETQEDLDLKPMKSQQLKGLSLASYENGIVFLAILRSNYVQELVYFPGQNSTKYHQPIFEGEADLVALSPRHEFLYVVTKINKKLSVFNLSRLPFNTTNKQSLLLQREFSFTIKTMITDSKDPQSPDRDGLILVSQDSTIFYTKRGSIIFFVPYQEIPEDTLLFCDFCEKKYFLTLHKRPREGTTTFYLSFFDKRTFFKEKVIDLSSIFGEISDVISMECNHRSIVLLTNQEILLLSNNYFDEDSLNLMLDFELWQWGLTALVIATFLCCCRRRRDKTEDMVQSLLREACHEQESSQEDKGEGEQRKNTETSSSKAVNSKKFAVVPGSKGRKEERGGRGGKKKRKIP